MKYVHLFGIIFATSVIFLAFSGCKTSEPVIVYQDKEVVREVQVPVQVSVESAPETLIPLTPAILQRLRDSGTENMDERIKRYQFRLVGRISLEREYTRTNDGLIRGGTARFENWHIRETIIISDQTDGQAITMRTWQNETTLHLCFEDDDKYELVFVARHDEPDGFFCLSYIPTTERDDEKGTLFYGEENYRLKFGDRPPYIMIKLSQKDIEDPISRVAPGRKVD